jgi:hypothetical protein
VYRDVLRRVYDGLLHGLSRRVYRVRERLREYVQRLLRDVQRDL